MILYTGPVIPLPKNGQIRYKTKFAFVPTTVYSRDLEIRYTIWLQNYVVQEEFAFTDYGHTWIQSQKFIK